MKRDGVKQSCDCSTLFLLLGTNASIFNTQDQAVPFVPPAGDFLWHHTRTRTRSPTVTCLSFYFFGMFSSWFSLIVFWRLISPPTCGLWQELALWFLWPALRILHLITMWKLLTDLLSERTIKAAGSEWGLASGATGIWEVKRWIQSWKQMNVSPPL